MYITIKDEDKFEREYGIDTFLEVERHELTQKEEKVFELFQSLKENYPEVFEGVSIYFTDGINMTTCYHYFPSEVDISHIFISEDSIKDLCQDCPTWKKTISKKLKKIKSDLNLIEFALLHELGHYLDRLDNIDRYDLDMEQLPNIRRYILKKFHNLTHDESQILYIKTPLEKRANTNAFKMAEVLNRE